MKKKGRGPLQPTWFRHFGTHGAPSVHQVFLAKDRMFKDRQVAIKKERGSGENREKPTGSKHKEVPYFFCCGAVLSEPLLEWGSFLSEL